MTHTVQVRNIRIGEGIPKICVPIAGRTREEILLRMEEWKAANPDLAEWRADWYEDVRDREKVLEILQLLREGLGESPLLVTFRTAEEGGEREIEERAYRAFLLELLDSSYVDLLDVELFRGEELLAEICEKAHEKGILVIASSHDFQKTPAEEEMIRRLCRMQELGADLLKLAVMPESEEDVLRLLQVTQEMKEKYARRPLITMSMGGMGVLSRLSGEIFGSALTFGTAGQASAPGQMEVEKLKTVLRILHESRE